jgi:small-conductance mechanosensitive channel
MIGRLSSLQIEAQAQELEQLGRDFILFLPNIIAAIIILIIGWLLGRFLGRIVADILDRVGLDDALRKTALGQSIEQSGYNIVNLFEIIVRWFIYLLAILAALGVLQLVAVTVMVAAIAAYIPNIIAFILILVIGLIVVDWIVDVFQGFGESQQVQFVRPVALALRVFLYFVVVILALQQLALDLTIIYVFVVPIAWGVGLGIGAAIAIIVGFGLKDRAPQIMDDLMGKVK